MNKGLELLNLKKCYDPSVDGTDLVKDFYIPCLSSSIKYDRISAYFSSAVLQMFSKGLINFFNNGGHARFIFSCQIDAAEMANISNGYKQKMDLMADDLNDCILQNYEVANLSYLIAHNYVEVKIAFMIKDSSAIMHIKSGSFEDLNKKHVFFEGSGNETKYGILKNAETFMVFNDFVSDNEYVKNGIERFEKIWNNTYSPSTIRAEFPIGKLFEKLISFNKERVFNSNDEFMGYNNCIYIDIDLKNKKIILFDYTKEEYLKKIYILKNQFQNKWNCLSDNRYLLDDLNVYNIKEVISKRLNKFKINYVLSPSTLYYLQENDLELETRKKIGLSIKNNDNIYLWANTFEKFKYIVNLGMLVRLKEKQMNNAFYHYMMKSSSDFSVPGTGKTYISYGLFTYLYSNIDKAQECNKMVVFGPLNCFKAWKDECANIYGANNRFKIFEITKFHENFENEIKKNIYHIYLINYDFINSDDKVNLISKFLLNSKTLVIFDEIHKIKSINGVRANLFLKMLQSCQSKPVYKLALTGTPIPNSFLDISNYLKILYPEDLQNALIKLSDNRLKQGDNNPIIAKEISETLQPFFVRTTKKDLQIPMPLADDIETLAVLPTQDEQALFDLIWKNCSNPLLKFIRLIQASSNPKLLLNKINCEELKSLYEQDDIEISREFDDIQDINQEDIATLVNNIGISTKTKATISQIETLVSSNQKVLVWCLFIDTIDFISSSLGNKGINVITITGRDNPSIRENKIDSFKNGNIDVLITNPNTLAESVSLHKICHNAIYLEFGFNLTYLLQSKDRIHRVGIKPQDITKYYFSITLNNNKRGSIDEYIYNKLKMKEERMKYVIESNTLTFVPSEGEKEDILEIIRKSS